jgi:hypothetical protein
LVEVSQQPEPQGVPAEHSHWRELGLQVFPVGQLAMQVPPQSSGVVPEQPHWLLWQVFPPVQSPLVVH